MSKYAYSQKSIGIIRTCARPIQVIMADLIQVRDVTALEGHRPNQRQAELLALGRTTLGPGRSKHNSYPSEAIDLGPYPIHWISRDDFIRRVHQGCTDQEQRELINFLAQWYELAGIIQGIAYKHGIKIRQGIDWDGDHDFLDQNFDDLPHLIELVGA